VARTAEAGPFGAARIDVLLLAPRLPGQYVRQRYLDWWGVPAFVSVERDASGRAWPRLLALTRALGITRCAALEVSFAEETELDYFCDLSVSSLDLRDLRGRSLFQSRFPVGTAASMYGPRRAWGAAAW
jgi:hypothetical protein